MAGFARRSYIGQRDMDEVSDLLLTARILDPHHTYPTLPRLRTLLTCRLWQPEEDAQLWTDAAGHLVGLAAIVPPKPHGAFLPLALVAHPRYAGGGLSAAMLDWAVGRAHEQAKASEPHLPSTLYVQADEDDFALQQLLAHRGFTRQPTDLCYMLRPLVDTLPEPMFPVGFTLHRVPASDDLDRYLDRYRPIFERWNLDQRRRRMADPDFDPTLGLIVEAADGMLAAYCECSISRTEWAHGDLREGWIDIVATRPQLQRRGIGRALLLAALKRLHSAGADAAHLFTESSNLAARPLYAALGFQTTTIVRQYARTV